MELILIDEKDIEKDLKGVESSLITEAKKYVENIRDEHSCQMAIDMLFHVKEQQKKISEILGSNKQKAYKAWKSAVDLEKKALDPYEKAETIYKTGIMKFDHQPTGGISYVEKYKAEIVDESLVPDQYKMINIKEIERVVNSLGENAVIPGVRVLKNKIMRVEV